MQKQSTRFGLVLAAVTVAMLASCKQGPAPIPVPSPDSSKPDQPGAAERKMTGSSTLGIPSAPPPSLGPTAESEAAGLAITTSIAEAKRTAAAHTLAAHGARAPAVPVPPGGSTARLVFAASTAGQLVPCGCSPDQRGGLPRAAGLLALLRTEAPGAAFIDAGDLLFASATRPEGPAAQQAEEKARTLAQASRLLGAAARVVGARDLALGEPFVTATAEGVPLVASGAPFGAAQASVLLMAGAPPQAFGLLAIDGPLPAKDLAARVAGLRKAGARLVVAVLHPKGDRAVQAAQGLLGPLHEAGVDLAVLGHRDDPGLDPDLTQAGALPLLGPEGHGQALLVLDLVLPPPSPAGARENLALTRGEEGKREELAALDQRLGLLRERAASADAALAPQLQQKVAELEQRRRATVEAKESLPAGAVIASARFLKLDRGVPSDAAAAALVARYDAAVAAQNLAAAKLLPDACPPAAKGEPAFVGLTTPLKPGQHKSQESCATCHPDEVRFWARTVHARAYLALEQVNKQHSLDCIACHVTGWQQPGGVCRIDRTAAGGPGVETPAQRIGNGAAAPTAERLGVGRQGVQCEACHGPASEHVRISADLRAGPGKGVPVQTCTRCHEAENSPHFDFARYLPWVVGPGHGEALPRGQEPRSRGELTAGNTLGPNPTVHAAPAKEP